MSVQGNYAYLCVWEDGVRVIDVSDPRTPRKVGSCERAQRVGPLKYDLEVSDYHISDLLIKSFDSRVEATVDHWSLRKLAPGDFDYDGVLDAKDIDMLSTEIRAENNDPRRDLNLDTLVNNDDRNIWVHDLKTTWFGDSDLDGEFNSTDLVEIFQSGEYEDGIDANSTWATGDWNGDSEFDSSDLVLAFADGGYEVGPRLQAQSVPEPTSILSLTLAGVLMTVSSRHRPIRSEMFG